MYLAGLEPTNTHLFIQILISTINQQLNINDNIYFENIHQTKN
jgi:hypothetical protein